jgi:hemolysin activation/secretion protein
VFRKQKAEREATEAEQKRQQQEKEYEEFLQFKAAKANGTAPGTAAAASTEGADAEEPADAPTIKCVALKNFQFKGEKYKENDERELTFATIQAMGKDKIKVLDVPAYQAAKAAEAAKK